MPSEFEWVARHFAPLAREFAGAYDLLDDVAVISPGPGRELVVKSDVIVAGIDFPPDEPATLVARKALRVNLSDLAAKGAAARAYLVDLILPQTVDEGWIASFAEGLARDQAQYGIHLIGGDLSSTSGPITVAVTAFGEVPLGKVIRRGGAQAGDSIFVTGTIGDAALGLGLLRSPPSALDRTAVDFLTDRYRLPQPRVILGSHLIGIATASLDISDGLVADLRHLCSVSRLSARIEADRVPLSHAARLAIGGDPQRLTVALTGGDDYEILFTANPMATSRIRELSEALRTVVTPIGHMTASASADGQSDVAVLDASGRRLQFAAEGWTHF